MASKKYEIHEDGSITFPEGVEIDDKTRAAAEKAAREKASDIEDDLDVRETAEGKSEREKAGN